MSRVITKLFRDPEEAALAVKRLKEESLDKGLSIIARSDAKSPASAQGMKHHKVKINAHDVTVAGALSPGLEAPGGAEKADEAMRSGLSLSEEGFGYFKDALAAGGILVSLEADEEQAKRVSVLFRSVQRDRQSEVRSKTFYQSSRMAGTNAIDAAMSGDFRKY